MPLLFIDGYPFDLVVSKGASYASEVAEHPVDADADVTDHIRNKPLELTLECVVSDTPTGEIASHPTRAGATEGTLFGEAAFDKLLDIRSRKRPVTIETAKRTYDNMGMTSLERQDTVETTGGALFTVGFRRMNILANKRVTVRVAAPIVKGKAKVGLSIGPIEVVPSQRILWRKGSPPGTSPATDPPGKIVGQEYVTADAKAKLATATVSSEEDLARRFQAGGFQAVNSTGFFHESTGKELTPDEIVAFRKDLARDQVLALNQLNARNARGIDDADIKLKNVTDYAEAKEKYPGVAQFFDPRSFGF
jgi:hypothetical protein